MASNTSQTYTQSAPVAVQRATNIRAAATQLAECIETLKAAGLDETAGLVRIAHLDLVCALHGISHEELDALVQIVHVD